MGEIISSSLINKILLLQIPNTLDTLAQTLITYKKKSTL
jgi:hypothetical protein